MQEYRVRPGGFSEVRKQILIRTIPIIVIAVAAGALIGSLNSSTKSADINIWPIFIPIVVLAVGFGLFRGIKRQKMLFESYKLTLDESQIKREQLNTPTICIDFNDISEIIKTSSCHFIIKGTDKQNTINVPAQIDDYSKLENTLNQIKPVIVKSSQPFSKIYQLAFVLLTLALMASGYTLSNKIVVVISGSCVIAILLWSLVKIRTNKNIDVKTKRTAWVVLIVIVSIIFVMYNKLIV